VKTKHIAAAVTFVVALGGATAAQAETDTTTSTVAGHRAELRSEAIDALKARGDFEVDRRLRTLSDLTRRVQNATHLTAANRDALTAQLAAETSGLTALKAKIDADTDLATLRADLRSIVSQYRVYLLMDPKVHLVIAADRALAAADAFDKVFARLDGKPGVDQAKLADAKAKVAEARSLAGAVPGSVIPLQPPDYPGNRPTLESARDHLRTARQDLRAARAEVGQLVAAAKA
jgi:hypothetical protein